MNYENLMEPVEIGNMKLRNRTVMPGMGTNLASYDGTVSDIIVDYYGRRANGGTGLIITEVCAPEAEGRVIPGELEITGLGYLPGLSRLVAAAHSGGSKIALQLAHGGCFASEQVTGVKPKTPSGVGTALLPEDEPREMTKEEIHDLINNYGKAGKLAKMAGFDAVELHGAHGYMPLQFLSGYTNRRTDEYGGSLENRARFPLEVIKAIKEQAGSDFPIIYRLSCEEDVPRGLTPDEAVKFSVWAEEAGVDALNISVGTWDTRMSDFQQIMTGQASPEGKKTSEGVSIGSWVPPIYVPRGNLISYAEKVKQQVSVPVITAGSISPELAEETIKDNKADLACMGRQLIADPDYPNKLREEKPEEIRRCVRCNECLGAVLSYRGLDCAVNAEAGKEHETFVKSMPSNNKKKIFIAGGGPAGMEAAIKASSRGHDVTLYEQEEELGGMLRYLSIPEFKKDYLDFMNWQISELYRKEVKVELGTSLTSEIIRNESPDTVIVATGAKTSTPNIEGITETPIHNPLEVLDGKIPQGNRVVVCGGGLVGAEVAMHLTMEHDKQVVMLEQQSNVVPELEIFSQWVVQSQLVELGIEIKVDHCIEKISEQGIMCTNGTEATEISADDVVVALGMKPEITLLNEIEKENIEVISVGDAVEPRKVIHAIHEGYHVGRRV